MRTTPNVPIGVATVAGYGGTIVGAIAGVLSMIFPDQDPHSIGLVASAVFTIGSFLVTQVGRYWQAKEAAKATAVPALLSMPAGLSVDGHDPELDEDPDFGPVLAAAGPISEDEDPPDDKDAPQPPAVDEVLPVTTHSHLKD